MAQSILNKLLTLDLSASEAGQLGLGTNSLKLRRAWPRAADRLGLEYVTAAGQLVAGQWFGCPEALAHSAQSTAKATSRPVAVVESAGTRLLLHSPGADRRLPGLASLLRHPDAHLLVHQPERRAVVRLGTHGQRGYAKLVSPERTTAIVAKGEAARKLPDVTFITPKLLAADAAQGLTVWSPLPGKSLYDLSNPSQLLPAASAAGEALRSMHTTTPPAEVERHDAEAEIEVMERWLERLAPFNAELHRRVRAATPQVYEALRDATSPVALLHRDFYDKQIFVDTQGQIGLLDFDTLATGEAALDLANALVHCELRALQGKYAPEVAARAVSAWLAGYQPDPTVHDRLKAYADAVRLRLACVYAFRPGGERLSASLLDRVKCPNRLR